MIDRCCGEKLSTCSPVKGFLQSESRAGSTCLLQHF